MGIAAPSHPDDGGQGVAPPVSPAAADAPVGLPSLTRRAVIGGAIGVAALCALGGGLRAFAADGDFLRPPGGQDYERFAAACIKCDRCRSACDRHAIAVCLTSDGLLNARLPKMNFRGGACDMCGGAFKCAAACPTGALAAFDPERDKMGVAVVDADECLTYNTSGHCDARCIKACAWGALSLDGSGKLRVDESRCNGCGACENVCPSSAYGMYGGSGRRGVNVEPIGLVEMSKEGANG